MIGILGAGELGLRVATRSQKPCRASTRSPERFPEIQASGAEAARVDLFDKPSVQSFCDGLEAILFSVAPGRGPARERLYGDGLEHLIEALDASNKAHVVFVSSTAVYDGYDDAAIITEETPAKAVTERSKPLLAAEQKLQSALGDRARILRLAGLYCAGRGPFNYIRPSLASARPLSGPGARYLSLLHYHDAASLALAMLDPDGPRFVLGADGHSRTRAETYGLVARSAGLPEPLFEDPSSQLTGRRIHPTQRPVTLRYPCLERAIKAGEI